MRRVYVYYQKKELALNLLCSDKVRGFYIYI